MGKSARTNMKQHTYAETKHGKPPLRCPLSAHNCTYTKPPRPVTVLLHRRNEKCISQRVLGKAKKKKKKESHEKEEIQKVNLSRKRLRDRTT